MVSNLTRAKCFTLLLITGRLQPGEKRQGRGGGGGGEAHISAIFQLNLGVVFDSFLGIVNSLYCGHPPDRELVSLIARVHNSQI